MAVCSLSAVTPEILPYRLAEGTGEQIIVQGVFRESVHLLGSTYEPESRAGGDVSRDFLAALDATTGAPLWFRDTSVFVADLATHPQTGLVSVGRLFQEDAASGVTLVEVGVISRRDLGGNFLWSRRIENFGSGESRVRGVTVAPSGRIFVVGQASGTVKFGDVLYELPYTSGFVAEVAVDTGRFQWVRFFDETSYSQALAVVADRFGNLYICGRHGGFPQVPQTIRFADGSTVTAASGSFQNFLVRYDQSGNFVWVSSAAVPGRYELGVIMRATPEGQVLFSDGVDRLLLVDAAGVLIWRSDQLGREVANQLGFPYRETWRNFLAKEKLITDVRLRPEGGFVIRGHFLNRFPALPDPDRPQREIDYTAVISDQGRVLYALPLPANGYDYPADGQFLLSSRGDIRFLRGPEPFLLHDEVTWSANDHQLVLPGENSEALFALGRWQRTVGGPLYGIREIDGVRRHPAFGEFARADLADWWFWFDFAVLIPAPGSSPLGSFVYIPSTSTAENFVLFSQRLNEWVWTSAALFPGCYLFTSQAWLTAGVDF